MKKQKETKRDVYSIEYGDSLAVRLPNVLETILCYPNSYAVGMASLGFQTIWKLLSRSSSANVERGFYSDAEKMCSIESGRGFKIFDIAAFSVSFELDYINLIKMLISGAVEPLAVDRNENDPLLIGGGAFSFYNPEVLASVFDIVFVGEAEGTFINVIDSIYDMRCVGKTKAEIIAGLADMPHLYIPSLHAACKEVKSVRKAVADDFTQDDIACSFRLSPESEFPDTFLIEIARGCGRHCRYCMAGYCYRKPRFHSFELLKPVLDRAMEVADKIGLVGAAVSDHPEVNEIVDYIIQHGKQISISSLRVETAEAELFTALATSGQKTVTFAPETASLRLRHMVNKDITDELLFEKIKLACECGLKNVRYYLMIGLPTEEDADIEANIDFILRADAVLREASEHKGRSTLSVGIFVPKPWTPFERVPMLSPKESENRLGKIQKELAKKGIRVNTESSNWAWIQGILARGGRQTGEKLVALVRSDSLSASKIKKAYADEPEDFFCVPHGELPWNIIDNGVDVSYIENEYEKALKGELTTACTGFDCKRCGVC